MDNAKSKNKKLKKKVKQTFSERLAEGWRSYLPVLKFVGGFIFLICLFYAFWFSSFFIDIINPKIAHINAFLASNLLHLLGQATTSSNENIYSTDFSISVSKGCDGIEAMAIFTSALLAFPISFKKKIYGLFIGIFILAVLNLLRIVSLFLIGKFNPSVFELFHGEIWPVVFILIALSLWAGLIFRSTKIAAKNS